MIISKFVNNVVGIPCVCAQCHIVCFCSQLVPSLKKGKIHSLYYECSLSPICGFIETTTIASAANLFICCCYTFATTDLVHSLLPPIAIYNLFSFMILSHLPLFSMPLLYNVHFIHRHCMQIFSFNYQKPFLFLSIKQFQLYGNKYFALLLILLKPIWCCTPAPLLVLLAYRVCCVLCKMVHPFIIINFLCIVLTQLCPVDTQLSVHHQKNILGSTTGLSDEL